MSGNLTPMSKPIKARSIAVAPCTISGEKLKAPTLNSMGKRAIMLARSVLRGSLLCKDHRWIA
eukprot:4103625-Prorocentrum_lima.AAC.1